MSSNNNDVEKRSLIMKSARDLFFQFGLSKTSMEDIARQSGMAKPTLYYYYANKETIFNEVVIKEAQAFMDKVEKKLPKDSSAEEKIAVFFRTVYQDLKVYAAKMEKVPVYMCEHSPHGRPIVEKINALFRAKLLPLLASGKEEGSFEFGDVDITVSTLVFMTDFLNFDWMHHNPERVRDQVVETMIEIILKGLKRRP